MILNFASIRLRIHFNSAFTIQRIEFFGGNNERLLVMFKEWGVYTPGNPNPIRLELSCGGIVVTEDEFGEFTMGTCFLKDQEGALVQSETEVEITAFTLKRNYFGVEVVDEGQVINIEYPQKIKMRGVTEVDGQKLFFHEWRFDRSIILILDDGKPFTG